MTLKLPATPGLTKKCQVCGGQKLHGTKILGQSALWLAQFTHEDVLPLKQQKVQQRESRLKAEVQKYGQPDLDLLETEKDIKHEVNESSDFSEEIYETLLQIDNELK